MIGPTLGPVLGGFISDHYGWRMIFNINIPIGLMVLALAWIYIKDATSEDEAKPTKKFDLVGMVLMVLAIGCLDYALERGPTDEWFDSKVILACVLIAAVCLPLFIVWELTVKEPLVNLRYLGLKPVWVGSMHISISSFTIMGVFFIIPIFLSTAFHFEARQIGELFVPGSAIGIVTMNLAGQLLVRGVSARLLMIFGVLGTEFFLYQLTQFSPMTSWNAILFALMMRGATIAFLFVPLNAAVLGAFRGRDLRAVSGLTNLIRTVAGNAGIAFMAGFFQIQGHQNQTELLSKVNALQPQAVAAYHQSIASFAKKFGDSLGLVEKTDVAHKMLDLKVNAQVQFVTFIQASHIMMCAGLLLLIPIFLLPPAPRKKEPEEAAVTH
jgi:DHA2 family multidrug resistance protein